jgi:hypothetical protein
MKENRTTFSKQCEMLADIWVNYREDGRFTEFLEYNDLGLPLAHAVHNDLIEVPQGMAKGFIEEAFLLLLEGLGIEDKGYRTLEEVFRNSNGFEELS